MAKDPELQSYLIQSSFGTMPFARTQCKDEFRYERILGTDLETIRRNAAMIKGILVVNLEPAYMGFLQAGSRHDDDHEQSTSWRSCSLEDIRNLLIDLGAINPGQQWPLRECILRLPIELPASVMRKFRLGRIQGLDALVLSKEPTLRHAG